MLCDACIGNGGIAVIHNGNALIIAFSVNPFEIECTIAKAAMLEIKKAVNGAGIDYMVPLGLGLNFLEGGIKV